MIDNSLLIDEETVIPEKVSRKRAADNCKHGKKKVSKIPQK